MNLIRHRFVVTICLVVSSPASASEWWRLSLLGEKPHRQVVLADLESIHTLDGHTALWIQRYIETPNRDRIKTNKVLYLNDCEQRRLKVAEVAAYDRNGKLVGREQGKGSWFGAPPESMAESILTFACGNTSNAIKFDGYNAHTVAEATLKYEE